MQRQELLMSMYHAMATSLGPSNWWPGDSPFEIAVGAILTQNTNWQNVEKAITQLKNEHALTPLAMHTLQEGELARLIRPAGYFNVKAKRLRALLDWMQTACNYDLTELRSWNLSTLREALLSVKGIGPETADSILLYVAEQPSFVVDAYTKRIYNRHGLVTEDIAYEELRDFFMDVLPADTALFNEYHALIVRVGKEWCHKSKPDCSSCPLAAFLPEGAVHQC